MDLNDVSIKWKTAVPILVLVIIGIIVTVIVTGARTKDIVIKEAANNTLPAYRDTVLNSLTTLMIGGNYRETKKPFIEQMTHIAKVKVIRAPSLDNQFGKGANDEYPSDKNERLVVETGREMIIVDSDHIHGIYPYLAKSSFMGKNCLDCHQVKEGTVLGAVSIMISLDKSYQSIRRLQLLYLTLGLAGIFAFTVVVLFVFKYTHAPLLNLTEEMKKLVKKNLRISVVHEGKRDEVMLLSANIDKMIEAFNEAINKIIITSSEISSTVDMLHGMAEKASQGSATQTRQAVSIAAVAEQMSHTINEIAKNASTAAEISKNAMDTALGGRDVSDATIKKINNAFQATINLSTMLEKLNHRVSEIGDVVTVIKDIADQTNLLALNAAIEAARAGEQGRGFAVVADEVRKLAERTIRATEEVSKKIGAVQTDSSTTTELMAAASEEVSSTNAQIKKVGGTLEKIVGDVQNVRDRVMQIATAVEEQSSATDDVAHNIENSATISRELEKMAGAVKRDADRLHSIVQRLRDYTSEFKTRGAQLVILELAKNDHKGWVKKVEAHMSGETILDPASLADHTKCRLGKWYYAEGMRLCGDLKSYKELEPFHAKVHSIGKDIILKHDAGMKSEADILYRELKQTSEKVLTLLDEIGREYDIAHGRED